MSGEHDFLFESRRRQQRMEEEMRRLEKKMASQREELIRQQDSKVNQVKNEYNKILPAIQANLTILRLASFISSDKDINKTIQFITDHIKTTVFDESLISSENKQLYTIMSHAKRWASGAILGFN